MVQTRSAERIKSGQVNDDDGTLPKDNAVELPPDDGAPPPAKRRRRECIQVPEKSRQAKPGDLFQLNLDVLYLICASLHPLDLLNLARVCKYFRGLLMSKSSAFIWRAVRRQFNGLPDCPADLSEPAYANLAFSPRCHVCGKYAAAIYWYIRRRYCPDCRVERLCDKNYCPQILRLILFRTRETILVQKKYSDRYDRDLVDSVVQEYERSSNKEQFLRENDKHYIAMNKHARDCEEWQRSMALKCRDEQKARRRERDRNILERIKQLGYEREIRYFGPDRFKESRKKSPKPLTDREWARILPGWLETMNHHRQLRLDAVVYPPRRRLLVSEYKIYVRQRSSDIPTFDLLPHVIDLACFPPFRDIIEAPEETQMDEKPFASAFAQLPVLVDEWRKQLDTELAELVKIPPRLALGDTSRDLGVASNNITRAEEFQTGTDKLRLACALFHTYCTGLFTHPEIFSTSMLHYSYPRRNADASERTGTIETRFGIRFLKEAPYIVHACGLDPNVATVDDMDRRDARLRCLACETPNVIVMNWRDAMWHAFSDHRRSLVVIRGLPSRPKSRLAPLSESPRWQLVSDEYIGMIQAVEESITREALSVYHERCLLCLHRVGDAMNHESTIGHLWLCHEVKEEDIKRGVHYARLGIHDARSTKVEMVEEGGQVTFREPQYH